MLRLIFPPLKHPEDANDAALLGAKLLLVFGIFSLVWSGARIARSIHALSYKETTGILTYDDLAFRRGLRGATYTFTVDGKTYGSEDMAIGGRNFGRVPPPGPVTVYYDPKDPRKAVLSRRPVETVYIALAFGLASPFLARKLWDCA